MKTRALKTIGHPTLVGRCRQQRCVSGKGLEGRIHCPNKTRLVALIPLSDIEEDGTFGFGAVVLCPEHLEEAIVRLTDAERKEQA